MVVPLLQLVHIGCADGDFQIVQDINWDIYPGCFYRIIGANGSGKSSLLALISGMRRSTSGLMLWKGGPVSLATPREALKKGIVHLEERPRLFAEQTAVENVITIAHCRKASRVRFIRKKQDTEVCRALFQELELDLDPNSLAGSLTLAQQRIIELAHTYYTGASLLLMDEPVGWATPEETAQIQRLVTAIMRKHNTAVLTCSSSMDHREDNLFPGSTLYLKHGKPVACVDNHMSKQVPLDFQAFHLDYPKIERTCGKLLIEIRDLYIHDFPVPTLSSMTIHTGEIIGVFGMDMRHCQAFYEIFNGYRHDYSGEILIDGRQVQIQSPRHAQRLGIACQPLSRDDALFWNLSLQMNLAPVGGQEFFTSARLECLKAASRIHRLHIGAVNVHSRCNTLSSGARQKVLLSRYLEQNARVFVLFHPTSDMDKHAKLDIYNLITHLQQRGCSLLLFSNDLDELAYMCDKIYVMHDSAVCTIRGNASQRAAQLYQIVAGLQR